MDDYYLHVDMIVPERSHEEYERGVAEFLEKGGFRRLVPECDHELILALRTPNAFDYTGYDRFQSDQVAKTDRRSLGKVYRYVNLWHVVDHNDLGMATVMKRSADDYLYVGINQNVVRELQNLVLRVAWLDQGTALESGEQMLRIIRQFPTPKLGEYLFTTGMALPQLESNGWHSLGHFQNITGTLNTVTEFWNVDKHHSASDVHAMAAALDSIGAPELRERLKKQILGDAICTVDIREIFQKTSYSPRR